MLDATISLAALVAVVDAPLDSNAGGDMAATILFAQAMAAAAAALALLALGWPWRAPAAQRAALGWVAGIAAGLLAGYWALDAWPKWTPLEDQGRFVFLLLPAAVVVEALAAVGANRWLAWLLRIGLALAIAPTILHGSLYLADAAGEGSQLWTPLESAGILAAVGAAIAGLWFALAALQQRTAGRSVPLAFAATCAGAGVTVMLSGSASGGQLGLTLAAALTAATGASLLVAGAPAPLGGLGVAIVSFASLLLAGRFFGSLTTVHALLLFATPFLMWLPEALPSIRPWVRGLLRVAVVLVPIAFCLSQAQQAFVDNSRPSGTSGPEPSINDYLNFGK